MVEGHGSATLEIVSNRSARKWSRRELVGRVLWFLVAPLFRFSPRLCWGWRRWLLRRFGANVGRHVQIHPRAQIFIPWNLHIGDWSAIGFDVLIYNLGLLEIGQRVTISHRAHLCGGTHDWRDPTLPLIKSRIAIGEDAWVCASAFVGPGVSIGDGAVVGAGAVVVRDVEPWTVVAGNPAVRIKLRVLQGKTSEESR